MFNLWLYIVLLVIQFHVTVNLELNGTRAVPYITVDLMFTGSKDTYIQNFTVSDETTDIILLQLNQNCSFFILQVHTIIEEVTLSYSKQLQHSGHVNGTNIGLYWGKNMIISDYEIRPVVFFLKRFKPVRKLLNVLIVVSTYENNDPVPGGCNLSFETEIAPYQKIMYDQNTLTVTSQPPSTYTGWFPNCKNYDISTIPYYMFINTENDIEDHYFDTITKMLTINNIRKYASALPVNVGYTKFKQTYSSYRRTGYLFTMVSTLNNRTSIYVPAISWGCNISNWEEDCIEFDGVVWRATYSMLIICGFFILFFGHHFFKVAISLSGFTFGIVVTYIFWSIHDNHPLQGKLWIALFIGIFTSIALLYYHRRFNKPKVVIQAGFILFGFIIASFWMYGIGTLTGFMTDVWFNFCFIFILIIFVTLLWIKPHYGNMIALSFVGSYAFIVGVSIFNNSHIQYILINVFRRLAVTNLNTTIPFNKTDISMIIGWVIMCGVGLAFQIRKSIGKPPFPAIEIVEDTLEATEEPETNGTPNDRTPLLACESQTNR